MKLTVNIAREPQSLRSVLHKRFLARAPPEQQREGVVCLLTCSLSPGPRRCSSPKSESPFTVPRTKPLTPSSVGDLHFSSHLRLSCASVLRVSGLWDFTRVVPTHSILETLKSRNGLAEAPLEAPSPHPHQHSGHWA